MSRQQGVGKPESGGIFSLFGSRKRRLTAARTALVLLGVGVGGVAHACPEDPEAKLATSIRAALGSFQSMDLEGFTAQRLDARRAIGCLATPIAREDAAAYHRLEAYDAFLARDEEGAFHDFRAALYAHWEYELPESIAPLGNPIRDAWTDAASYPLPTYGVAELPRKTALLIDGREQTGRPDEIASIVQLVRDNGAVVYSSYLEAGTASPDWKTADRGGPGAAPAPKPVAATRGSGDTPNMKVKTGGRPPKVREPIQVNTPMLIGGSVAALTGGVLYLAAASNRAAFDDLSTSFEDLDGLQTRTNALVVASGVSAGVGVGLGAASFVVAW